MNNFIFLSPNFPDNYWQFCRELKNNGMNVLGIGDCPYDNLSWELKESLTDYYYVRSLMDYNEVFRAVAFFTYKYGKIDWLESNNEFWLERDAALRKEFNITTGFMPEDMPKVKYKSKMKECYNKVGIKTAAYHLVDNLEGCKKFIKEYGYPVIVKPDNGVGANATYKLNNDKELEDFINSNPQTQYIMEEFLDAEVFSYDAVVNSKGEPIFETGNVTAVSIMDTVNNNGDSIFYLLGNPYKDVVEAGRKALKSFGVKSRFIHFEFFRLLKDQRLGKKGEVVALEVNMRPSGGISPDMMNYANSTNVYKIWADMICKDGTDLTKGERYFCAFIGRRDGRDYKYSDDELAWEYRDSLKVLGRVPDALSGAMGNRMLIINFKTEEEMNNFYKKAIEVK